MQNGAATGKRSKRKAIVCESISFQLYFFFFFKSRVEYLNPTSSTILPGRKDKIKIIVLLRIERKRGEGGGRGATGERILRKKKKRKKKMGRIWKIRPINPPVFWKKKKKKKRTGNWYANLGLSAFF